MRTTLNLDEALVEKARRLSGVHEKTALVHAGLEALIARQSARRLAALGGTQTNLRSNREAPKAFMLVDASVMGRSFPAQLRAQ